MLASLTRSVARCRSTRSLFTRAAPVVDARYCAPRGTEFTAAETWFDAFPVKDTRDDEPVMRIEKPLFSFPRRHLLLDVSAASRRPVLTVERSPTFFEVRRRWNVYDGDSTSSSDLLFVAVAQPGLFTTGDVHVHLAGRDDRDPDFVVDSGGFFNNTDYTVYRGGAALAQIERTVTIMDLLFNMLAYSISVNAGVDHAFVVALTVILAEIRGDDVERRRRERARASTRNSR